MKAIALAVLMLGAGLTTQAFEDGNNQTTLPQKWTMRFDLGGNVPDDPGLTLYDGPVTGGDSMDLSAGMQFDMAIGYRLAPWLSLEGELGFTFNEVDSVGNWSYPDSSLTQMSFMCNLVFELPRGPLVPYVGVGAGGVFSSLSFGNYDYYYYYYGSSSDGYGNDCVPAAQLFGGLRYKFGDRASLGVVYRFLVTDGQKWDVEWWNGADFTVGVDSIATQSLCLVYSFSF